MLLLHTKHVVAYGQYLVAMQVYRQEVKLFLYIGFSIYIGGLVYIAMHDRIQTNEHNCSCWMADLENQEWYYIRQKAI